MISLVHSKKRLSIVVVIVGATALLLGFFFFGGRAGTVSLKPAEEDNVDADMGITYLPVTPGVSEYYDLGVKDGDLVTSVLSGSLAGEAGVQPGDVIMSFNGDRLDGNTPLLGAMMACPPGHDVIMNILRQHQVITVEFFHRPG